VEGFNWTSIDQSVFQNTFLLPAYNAPGYSGPTHLRYRTNKTKVFIADNTIGTVDEINNYSDDTALVRCFQDSSKPVSDGLAGPQ
jgi:hypothetical protein